MVEWSLLQEKGIIKHLGVIPIEIDGMLCFYRFQAPVKRRWGFSCRLVICHIEPALVRSRITSRSNSASAPKTWKTSFSALVAVLKCSWRRWKQFFCYECLYRCYKVLWVTFRACPAFRPTRQSSFSYTWEPAGTPCRSKLARFRYRWIFFHTRLFLRASFWRLRFCSCVETRIYPFSSRCSRNSMTWPEDDSWKNTSRGPGLS